MPVSTLPYTKSVTVRELVHAARGLKSEHGENKEYDRALVELITEVAGLRMEDRGHVANVIGVREIE